MSTITGHSIYALATRLWPINRSITGHGVRETLAVLKEIIPHLKIHEVPSGTQVFDWTIPDEWNVKEAWIEGPDGKRVVDFAHHNLHLMGYSTPIDKKMDLEELQKHLYSLPEKPNAIPYITSYYAKRWGFCLTHENRQKLKPGTYRVRIDATLGPGSLTYGELIIPGSSTEEIFLSSYVCHPSMANNELSGPCVTAFLAKWISELPKTHYTYRIVFIPETIGSITYLSRNLDHMKKHVKAGFNITCIGDERAYSFIPTRAGNTLSDQVLLHVLKHTDQNFKRYTYLDRGSDERQYCAPGIDLPIATVMRSRFLDYPEYHTSLDDLTLITPEGLEGGLIVLQKSIEALENNFKPKVTVLGEPQLGKRGLYPTISTKETYQEVKVMMDLLAYSDGQRSLLEIGEVIGVPTWKLIPLFQRLSEYGLLVATKG